MGVSAQLTDELREILRELGEAAGAAQVWIGPAGGDNQQRDLGRGKALFASFGEQEPEPGDTNEALERAARALRAAGRRWEIEELPDVHWPERDHPARDRVLERIEAYLEALANTDNCDNLLLVRDAVLIAAASPPTELQRARIAFAIKQVQADAGRRAGTSHGEIVGDDIYVRSFYVDAALVGFFSGPWATDFVRHRARRVARELAHLLSMLDEPPPSDAAQAPIPE